MIKNMNFNQGQRIQDCYKNLEIHPHVSTSFF